MLKQFLHFGLIGALGTAMHYALLIALVQLLAVHEGIAAMCGAALGAICNYVLNYHFNFRSTRRHREALPRFLAMAGIGIALNGFIVAALSKAGLHYLLAQATATVLVLSMNFLVSRTWIFVNRNT